MCAALRWMTFCLLLCWMPHCLHFRSEIKIKHVVSEHNFWDDRDNFYELYDTVPHKDIRWNTWGNGNCSTERICARNVLCKTLCILPLLGLHTASRVEFHSSSCTSHNILTPSLVTLTRWTCFFWIYYSCPSTCEQTRKQGITSKVGDYCSQLW